MKQCPNCHKNVAKENHVCPYCGASFRNPTLPSADPDWDEWNNSKQPKKSLKFPIGKKKIALIGVVLLVGLIACLGFIQKNPTKLTQLVPEDEQPLDANQQSQKIKKIFTRYIGRAGGNSSYAFVDLTEDTNVIRNNNPQRAAGLMSLYVMAHYYQKVTTQQVDSAAEYTLTDSDIDAGSSVLGKRKAGDTVAYETLVEMMIVGDDNAATNILIDYLGGISEIQNFITEQGFEHTEIQRKMLDQFAINVGKENYTSVQDLTNFLKRLYRGELLNPETDQKMLALLGQQKNQQKLTRFFPEETEIYHKAGEFSDYHVDNDAVLFVKDEKAYIIVAMMEKSRQDANRKELMQELGVEVYNVLYPQEKIKFSKDLLAESSSTSDTSGSQTTETSTSQTDSGEKATGLLALLGAENNQAYKNYYLNENGRGLILGGDYFFLPNLFSSGNLYVIMNQWQENGAVIAECLHRSSNGGIFYKETLELRFTEENGTKKLSIFGHNYGPEYWLKSVDLGDYTQVKTLSKDMIPLLEGRTPEESLKEYTNMAESETQMIKNGYQLKRKAVITPNGDRFNVVSQMRVILSREEIETYFYDLQRKNDGGPFVQGRDIMEISETITEDTLGTYWTCKILSPAENENGETVNELKLTLKVYESGLIVEGPYETSYFDVYS